MWTARENRCATALKSSGQQKDADHTFPTLFHRLTTITPERKEWEQGACGAKFNEFFLEKKNPKPSHSKDQCKWETLIPRSAGFQSLRSFTLRAPRKEGLAKKEGVRIAERLSKRFLAVAGTFGKENNQKRRRCALRGLTGTYPQSQERP
jgi:hypothetical protein